MNPPAARWSGPTPALLGIPYDAASSYLRGAAAAPAIIRQALRSPASNLWTDGGVDLGAPGALHDAGDLRFEDDVAEGLDGGAAVRAMIESATRKLLDEGAVPIVLGGDHSVTHPVLRAVRGSHPQLTVLHVDAHPDLYEAFEGDRYSHACPFARVMDERLCDHLVQVGIRTMTGHQREQASRFAVEVISMTDWELDRRPVIDGPVYLSIDIDAIDPAFAPGVSHREPGGLTVREVLQLIRSIAAPLVGADVVEFNPRCDVQGLTAPVAARLVKGLAEKVLERRRRVV